jgi:hypothetical protein
VTRIHLWFGALVQFVILGFLSITGADADLWGHVTFGTDMLRSGQIVQVDRYSFTSDLPWINHEWLAEIAMASAWRVGGAVGLTALKLSLFWAAGAFVLAAWRRYQLSPLWRDGLLFVSALGVWPLAATIRPQAFSVLLFAALLYLLTRVRDGSNAARLGVPLLFAIWVNTHGGWLVGGGVLAVFTGVCAIDRSVPLRNKLSIVLMSAASAAACLVNPYGMRMLDFLFATVRPDRSDIVEWRPVTALPLVALLLWAIPLVVAVIAFVRRRKDAPLWAWLAIALLAVGSMRVARLGGFFAVAVALLVAPLAAPSRVNQTTARARVDWKAVGASLCAAALAVGVFGGRISIDGPWAPEPGVSEFVRSHALQGRLLTWFDYGEYAIWHFSPAMKVSMDGRRETIYSSAIRDRHTEIYRDEPGALIALAQIRPDYIWLPASLPVVSHLESLGWHRLYEGQRSVILGLQPAEPVRDGRPVPVGRRFPGP